MLKILSCVIVRVSQGMVEKLKGRWLGKSITSIWQWIDERHVAGEQFGKKAAAGRPEGQPMVCMSKIEPEPFMPVCGPDNGSHIRQARTQAEPGCCFHSFAER